MIIQSTRVLLDKIVQTNNNIEIITDAQKYANDFYAWHVHLITINRRKAVVCMNNLTRYTIVLFRPKTRDYAQLGARIRKGIRAAFSEEGIRQEIIDAYLDKCGEDVFSKSAGRSVVSGLNKMCTVVQNYSSIFCENTLIQSRISLKLGNYLVKYGSAYDWPNVRLFQALCKMEGKDEKLWNEIFQIENYYLKVQIDLEKFDIWRRILIPSRCTFRMLHNVIQKTFGWFEYHLHEFTVFKELEKEKNLPLYART